MSRPHSQSLYTSLGIKTGNFNVSILIAKNQSCSPLINMQIQRHLQNFHIAGETKKIKGWSYVAFFHCIGPLKK